MRNCGIGEFFSNKTFFLAFLGLQPGKSKNFACRTCTGLQEELNFAETAHADCGNQIAGLKKIIGELREDLIVVEERATEAEEEAKREKEARKVQQQRQMEEADAMTLAGLRESLALKEKELLSLKRQLKELSDKQFSQVDHELDFQKFVKKHVTSVIDMGNKLQQAADKMQTAFPKRRPPKSKPKYKQGTEEEKTEDGEEEKMEEGDKESSLEEGGEEDDESDVNLTDSSEDDEAVKQRVVQ